MLYIGNKVLGFFLCHDRNLTRFFFFLSHTSMVKQCFDNSLTIFRQISWFIGNEVLFSVSLNLHKRFDEIFCFLLFLGKTNFFKTGAFTNSNHGVQCTLNLYMGNEFVFKRFKEIFFLFSFSGSYIFSSPNSFFFSVYQLDQGIFYILLLSRCTRLL